MNDLVDTVGCRISTRSKRCTGFSSATGVIVLFGAVRLPPRPVARVPEWNTTQLMHRDRRGVRTRHEHVPRVPSVASEYTALGWVVGVPKQTVAAHRARSHQRAFGAATDPD